MNRRNFFQKLGLAAGAGLCAKALQPLTVFAENEAHATLSLKIVTDHPEQAIEAAQRLLRDSGLAATGTKFSEALLPGEQVGDIVLVRDRSLVNFRTQQDAFSRELLAISRRLRLPRAMKDPVLLSFNSGTNNQSAEKIDVYHKNALVAQFEADAELDSHEVRGSKGSLLVAMHHGHARITDASCNHKTCQKMGSIHRPGQALVCIPNELSIVVAGRDERGLDSIAF